MGDDSEHILDELLALRCRRGDRGAWKDLVGRYERRLLYFIRRLVDAERDAWDVLQQTWTEAFSTRQFGIDDPVTTETTSASAQWLEELHRPEIVQPSDGRRAWSRVGSRGAGRDRPR